MKPRGRPAGPFRYNMNWTYFLLIGWWAGLLWVSIALMLCVTVILWPAGTAMLFKTPEITFGES